MAKRKDEWSEGKRNVDPLGFIWPVVSSIFGMFVFLLILFLLWIINHFIPTAVLGAIISFLYSNVGLLFIMSVAFGYANFLSRFTLPIGSVSPLLGAIGGILLVFFILNIIRVLIDTTAALQMVYDIIYNNILLVFVLFVAFGYLGLLMKVVKR